MFVMGILAAAKSKTKKIVIAVSSKPDNSGQRDGKVIFKYNHSLLKVNHPPLPNWFCLFV